MASPERKIAATQPSEGSVEASGGSGSAMNGNGNTEAEQKTAEQASAPSASENAVTGNTITATAAAPAASAATAPPPTAVPPAAASADPAAAAVAPATNAAQKHFDTDASKYSLKDLIQFQQQKCSVFYRLNFSKLKKESFNKLFPLGKGQVSPPKSFRMTAEMVQEWLNMTREEQLQFKERAKKAEQRQKRSKKRTGATMVVDLIGSKKEARKMGNVVALKLIEAPLAPPLSQPIPFLEGKLANVKLYYQEVPDGFTHWTDDHAVSEAFPAPRGCCKNNVPQCIIQDAQSIQDKLTVISWWRFLTKEEQKVQREEMKRVYAAPRVSNRKLPADFWEKLREHEEKRKPGYKQPVDPTGNDFYVFPRDKDGKPIPRPKKQKPKDTSCRGWKGESYEKLFQACYYEATKDFSMKGSAKILETIPVSVDVTHSKHSKDFVFVRDGDNYVLRSVGCTKKQEEKSKFFCDSCHAVCKNVYQLKDSVKTKAEVEAELKKQLQSVRSELQKVKRQEKRTRGKLKATPKKSTASSITSTDDDEPTPKKRRAAASPRHLSVAPVQRAEIGYVRNDSASRAGYGYY